MFYIIRMLLLMNTPNYVGFETSFPDRLSYLKNLVFTVDQTDFWSVHLTQHYKHVYLWDS